MNYGTMIPVYDGELLLVVQHGGDSTSTSVPPSREPLRPPNSVLDQTVSEKPVALSESRLVVPKV